MGDSQFFHSLTDEFAAGTYFTLVILYFIVLVVCCISLYRLVPRDDRPDPVMGSVYRSRIVFHQVSLCSPCLSSSCSSSLPFQFATLLLSARIVMFSARIIIALKNPPSSSFPLLFFFLPFLPSFFSLVSFFFLFSFFLFSFFFFLFPFFFLFEWEWFSGHHFYLLNFNLDLQPIGFFWRPLTSAAR
jgi:hypothetical protein